MHARWTAIFGLALAGCATMAEQKAFHLPADEVQAASRRSLQPEEREAEELGTYPPGLGGPYFSAARCRWVEPGRKAFCRYRVSRGAARPRSNRRCLGETAVLHLGDDGWSFAG